MESNPVEQKGGRDRNASTTQGGPVNPGRALKDRPKTDRTEEALRIAQAVLKPGDHPGGLAGFIADSIAVSAAYLAIRLAYDREVYGCLKHDSGTHANGQFCTEACFDE